MPKVDHQRSRENRWIALAEDGRHSTLGRDTDPTEPEVDVVEKALADQGLHGWLAVAEGDYWANRGKVSLMMVRPLGTPSATFESAAAAFEALRLRALQPA